MEIFECIQVYFRSVSSKNKTKKNRKKGGEKRRKKKRESYRIRFSREAIYVNVIFYFQS